MSDKQIKRREYNHWDDERKVCVLVRQVFSDDPDPEAVDAFIDAFDWYIKADNTLG